MPEFTPELNKAYIDYVNEYRTYTIKGSTAIDETNDLVLLEVSTRVKDPELLKIYRQLLPIQPLSVGNSDDVKVGAPVYVAGNPKGLEGTFSSGIISSRRGKHTEERLQMTAPVSSGSSGGPVLNNKGEVIGIAFMTIEGGQNLNFAIPSNYLKTLLLQSGTVKPLSENEQSISAETYFLRGEAMREMELYEEAIAAYDQAIRLKPDYVEAYNERGVAKIMLGQYFAAIADFDQAIQLKPDYADAYTHRGAVKTILDQNSAAIADYDRAIRITPDDAFVYHFRGMAKETLKQYFAAISDFDKAIKLKPDFAEAYHKRGEIKIVLGQPRAAISDFNKAIELKPDYAEVYISRGVSKHKLGQTWEAKRDIQTGSKIAERAGDTDTKDFAELTLRLLEISGR